MKSNELMPGDWVYYGKMVVPILQLSINREYPSIKPIPITPEILEKNGFEEFDGWRILDMDDVEIRWIGTILEISGSHGNMELPNVQHVHELQHAIRLCGIDKEIVL